MTSPNTTSPNTPLLDEAHESIGELRALVAQLNDHTLRLRSEIAVLIQLIEQERARREDR